MKQPQVVRRLLGRASWLMLLRLGGVAAQYATNILLARTLHTDDVAAYWLWTTIVILVHYIAGAGYESGALRYLPAYFEHRKWASARGFILQLGAFGVLGSIAFVAIGMPVAALAGQGNPLLRMDITIAGCVLLLPTTLLHAGSAVIRATHRPVLALLMPSVAVPTCLFAILALQSFVHQFTAIELLYLTAAVALAGCIVQAWTFATLNEGRFLISTTAAFDTAAWLPKSLGLGLFTLVWNLSQSVDFVIVGFLKEASQVALYGAAVKILAAQHLVSSTLTVTAASHLSAQLANREPRLQAEVAALTALSFVGMACSFAAFFLFGKWLLSLLNPQFVEAYVILCVLSFGLVLRSLFGPCEVVMAYADGERDLIIACMVVTLLTIGAGMLMPDRIGILGIAFAAVSAFTLTWIPVYFRTCRLVGFDISIVGAVRHLWQRRGRPGAPL